MKKITFLTLIISSVLFAGNFTNSIGMKFKEIPAGSFIMGVAVLSIANCPKDNPSTTTNEYEDCVHSRIESMGKTPAHKVNVKSFYMAETEVTQGQWYEVMGNNPAHFKTGDPNMPVENVSWNDAQNFIKKLNAKENTDKYRLPTEEEWEYAARAGTTTKWYCGDDEGCVSSIAVHKTSSPQPVKSKKPNAWGLYDMGGNVWEWTDSWYRDNYDAERAQKYKAIRGGSWYNSASSTRLESYNGILPGDRSSIIGFRLLRTK